MNKTEDDIIQKLCAIFTRKCDFVALAVSHVPSTETGKGIGTVPAIRPPHLHSERNALAAVMALVDHASIGTSDLLRRRGRRWAGQERILVPGQWVERALGWAVRRWHRSLGSLHKNWRGILLWIVLSYELRR